MKTIWKFDLPVGEAAVLAMPQGAKLLDVQVQDGAPRLWALVDPEEPTARRLLATHGTGHRVAMKDNGALPDHVGTFQLVDLGLVFHVFDHGEV